MEPASDLAASPALSFIAVAASCVNCLVSAPHHCIGSIAGVAASAVVGLRAPGFFDALAVVALAGAAASGSRSVIDSRNCCSGTFIVFSVDSVMRCTSSAWIVAASMRAFCSSQNCTVRSSSMRFSSSSGFNVGATHCPIEGSAEPAFLTRPCKKSKPGTSLLKFAVESLMHLSPL